MLATKEKNFPASSPLHFARFEFKYLLSARQRQAIESDLIYFLEYDPFVKDREGHQYEVRSLYYDDAMYSAFYDKIDGLHSRSKFRIRTYTFDSKMQKPIFLEIKGRHNNLVYKHRTPLLMNDLNGKELSGCTLTKAVLEHAEASVVRDQFEFDFFRQRLKPVALIDYLRRPYISRFDPGFRITFDENIRVTKTQSLFPQPKEQDAKKVLAGCTVLEVKFRHHMPAWFHSVIQAHELQRISLSKICSGMEVLGLAVDPD